MPIRHAVAGAILLAALATSAAYGQDDQSGDRRGFAGSIGIGVSSAGISCSPQCSADRETGPAYLIRIGGHATPQLTIGLETTLFRGTTKQVTPSGSWSLSWLTLTALWYPSLDDDFFVKAGVGIASSKVTVPFPSIASIELEASDFGAVAGIGKDFRFTDKLAFTTFADILFTPRTAAQANGSNSGAKISADLIHLGLAVTIP
jgi:hypothetical protein